MRNITVIVVGSMLALGLALPGEAQTASSSANATSQKSSSKKTEVTPPPSAKDIGNAKSQGLVWVNRSTRVYHKGGDQYGRTKHGEFMNEEEAKKKGFREAKEPPASKKSAKKTPDQSGVDATIDTHSSTPPTPPPAPRKK